jgi:hypothetical protein
MAGENALFCPGFNAVEGRCHVKHVCDAVGACSILQSLLVVLSTRVRPLLLPSASREPNATNEDEESDCNEESIEEKLAEEVVDVDLARGAQNGRGQAAGTAKVQIEGMGIISGGARGGGDGRTRALVLVEAVGASGVSAAGAD